MTKWGVVMGNRMGRFLLWLGIALMIFVPGSLAKSQGSQIVFVQSTDEGKSLYISDADGGNLRKIHSAKEIRVYLGKNHLLFTAGNHLYEYDWQTGKEKRWAVFEEPEIYLSFMPEGPDQALIIGMSDIQTNYYVIDFTDGNVRRIPPGSSGSGNYVSKITATSGDQARSATVKRSVMGRFELTVREGKEERWVLPGDMTLLPEAPIWSPDSLKLAFYAKPWHDSGGFYSLYVLDCSQTKPILETVHEDVFSKYYYNRLDSGGFTPDWDASSNYLYFSTLPYGVPSQSNVMQYDLKNHRKTVLFHHNSENYYPKVAPSGTELLFLSNREGGRFQLYRIKAPWTEPVRVSPSVGFTEWARWFNPSGD